MMTSGEKLITRDNKLNRRKNTTPNATKATLKKI
jgi:hypothetical protein